MHLISDTVLQRIYEWSTAAIYVPYFTGNPPGALSDTHQPWIFAPDRTLMISSPATYRDVKQELIAEIHRTAIWPVVVTVDGNISKSNNTGFIDGDGSYIILIPDGNFNSLFVEISGLVLDGESRFTKFFNSEARFIVAGANEYTLSQQKHIFDYLSRFRIYNCIIESQEHDVIDKVKLDKEHRRPTVVNDVDTSTKFGVYTWFPYQSSDICTEVNDISLLDSWVISAQGHFTKNTDLFPGKISNNLNRCPMKALVFDGRWKFTMKLCKHKLFQWDCCAFY